jgi:hypothetical protein
LPPGYDCASVSPDFANGAITGAFAYAASANYSDGDVEETYQQYVAKLRAAGIDPNDTTVPAGMRGVIDRITGGSDFQGAAGPIYNQDVDLAKETGGIQVYQAADGSLQVVPYVGGAAVCSAAAVSCMSAPAPDSSKGSLLFEWHPHPIGQPGSDLPSEADLMRSMRLNAPGVIWSKDGSTHNQIDYQAHPLH